MSTYERVADLPLTIDGYALEGLVRDGVERLRAAHHGDPPAAAAARRALGEDVTYEGALQTAQQEHGPVLPLAGEWTFDSFSEHLGELDLFPAGAPDREVFRNYRRWGFESAALDLALRQAGRSLADAVGRELGPVTFVVSTRMGDPPTHHAGHQPPRRATRTCASSSTRTPDWDDELIDGLIETGAVDSIDFKGAYKGTPVDTETDPAFYRRIAEAFPDAWLEDPDLETEEARAALEPFNDRITWDAPIHSTDDILAMPVLPRTVNLKPSRFGSVRALFEGYDFCEERGMGAYGGGQFELGAGPRADPVPRGALPSRRAERHRAIRV